MTPKKFMVPLRRVDDLDRLIDPIYARACVGGDDGRLAQAQLEDMRSRLDASLRALRRPAAGKLAGWAKLKLESIRADVRGSGDAEADQRIRALPRISRSSLRRWIAAGWALVLANQQTLGPALRDAGKTGRKGVARKGAGKFRQLGLTAEARRQKSGAPIESSPEYVKMEAMLETAKREGLDHARREFTKYARRHWLEGRGES